MLGIPFLSNYIERVIKVQIVADSVDWLNYYLSSVLLASFALAISAKQYFGSPIQCWVPNEFKGGWEKYAEDYCFISNSYHVPFEEDIQDHHRGDHLSYYRWVPIVLTLQAVCFYLPNWFWNIFHKQTAINPRCFLEEASKCKGLIGVEREREIKALAEHFMEGVGQFDCNKYFKRRGQVARSGMNATILYLTMKALFVVNALGQLIVLNKFLGGHYFEWAMQTAMDIVHGREWTESTIFPRVILCDFTVRVLGQNHRHTVQCVIMMNMINEKLYLFIHFWLMLVGFVTICNFFFYVINLSIPSLRTHFVLSHLEDKRKHIPALERQRFVDECLHPDGVLLLRFIREHVGGRVANELTHKLLQIYTSEAMSSFSSSERIPASPTPPQKTFGFSGNGKCNGSDRDTLPLMPYSRRNYADHYGPPPTAKGHAAPPQFSSTPNRSRDSAGGSEEFDRYPTMRADEAVLQGRSPLPVPRKLPITTPEQVQQPQSSIPQKHSEYPNRNSPTDV